MSDKPGPELFIKDANLNGPMPALYRLLESYGNRLKELDERDAEVERLQRDWLNVQIENERLRADGEQGARELLRLNAEVDRLQRDVNVRDVRMRQAEVREEGWRTRTEAAEVEVERLRAALEEALTTDHGKLGCCEWHILNGKPWIPVPTGVIHAGAEEVEPLDRDKECSADQVP